MQFQDIWHPGLGLTQCLSRLRPWALSVSGRNFRKHKIVLAIIQFDQSQRDHVPCGSCQVSQGLVILFILWRDMMIMTHLSVYLGIKSLSSIAKAVVNGRGLLLFYAKTLQGNMILCKQSIWRNYWQKQNTRIKI